MGTIVRPIIAIGTVLGLTLGPVAPALALGIGLSANTNVHAQKNEDGVRMAANVRANGGVNDTEEEDEEETDNSSSSSSASSSSSSSSSSTSGGAEVDVEEESEVSMNGGAAVEHESSVEARASLGHVISGMRAEFNAFKKNVRSTLQDERENLADLSADARMTLFTRIRALIHDALVALQADISAAIEAAVSA